MKDVEIKNEVKVEKKKVEKKVEKIISNHNADAGKVKFMESRNAVRAKSNLPEAYSEEEINSYR